jgi:hypothetical protein
MSMVSRVKVGSADASNLVPRPIGAPHLGPPFPAAGGQRSRDAWLMPPRHWTATIQVPWCAWPCPRQVRAQGRAPPVSGQTGDTASGLPRCPLVGARTLCCVTAP